MKIAILGATGALGRECLEQSLDAGHDVVVLARTPSKLPAELRERVEVIEGDALDPFSGFSQITFADCAHAMLGMLEDDTWLHKAPIIQY